MKKLLAILLVLFLLPCPASATSATPIVGDDGLRVMSPEQYLGIDPCDDIVRQDNWYNYRYINRELKWYSHGTDNPVDWYRMEDYVDALVDSGYYEILEYDNPYDKEEYWCLGYIGPGEVTKTFGANSRSTQKAAIIVKSNLGDFGAYYSLDITVDDLDETQERLGKDIYIYELNIPDDHGGGGGGGHWEYYEEEVDCPSCTFGNCSICNGRGYIERYGEKVSCDPDCSSCGGEGKITVTKQRYVTD